LVQQYFNDLKVYKHWGDSIWHHYSIHKKFKDKYVTRTPICHSICISKKITDLLLDVGIFDFFTPCTSDASWSNNQIRCDSSSLHDTTEQLQRNTVNSLHATAFLFDDIHRPCKDLVF
jgi:hypothetical protein